MGWFGRKKGGRHALGAAVTSIPSGPPAALLVPPTAPAAPVAPEVRAEPDARTSIAVLLATGEAWSTPDDVAAPARPAPAPVPPPLPVAAATAPAAQAFPLPQPLAPEATLPTVDAAPSARSQLEQALPGMLPLQGQPTRPAAPEVEPPAAAARVQLGFRDGSSTCLDPDSDQSLALQLLADSLTRRD